MKKDFKDELQRNLKAYGRESYSPDRMRETAGWVRAEYSRQKPKQRISYGGFLLRQVPFMGWRIWLCQAAVLAALCLLVNSVFEKIYMGIEPERAACSLGMAAIGAAMTAIPYLCRSLRYGMLEMEAAAKFSYSGILLSRILITGAGNLIMLATLFLIVCLKTSDLSPGSAVYMLLPFAMIWMGCLLIMRHVRSRWIQFYCAAFSVTMLLILFLLFKTFPQIFAQNAAPGWAVVCIVIIGGLFVQVKALRRKAFGMDGVSVQMN